MSATFEIEFKDNSGKVKKQLDEAIQIALKTVGIQAVSHAQQIITDFVVYGNDPQFTLPNNWYEKDTSRVDTGALRNSIDSAVLGQSVFIGSNLPYAPYHELGTGIYASQPGGRQSPWSYKGRDGNWHWTRGLYPIHFLKRAANNYIDEYKKIFSSTLAKIS